MKSENLQEEDEDFNEKPPFYRGAFGALNAAKKVDPKDQVAYDSQISCLTHGAFTTVAVAGFWAGLYDYCGLYKSKAPKALFFGTAVMIPTVLYSMTLFKSINDMQRALDMKYQKQYIEEFIKESAEMKEYSDKNNLKPSENQKQN